MIETGKLVQAVKEEGGDRGWVPVRFLLSSNTRLFPDYSFLN
jgi:hypothetical protein